VYQRPLSWFGGGLFDLIFLIGWRTSADYRDDGAIQTQALLVIISSQKSFDVIFAISSALGVVMGL